MIKRNDLKNILIQEQIKQIKKEVEQIKGHYYGQYIDSWGREYDIDLAYRNILLTYEPLIAEENVVERKLTLYKEMYYECLELVYEEIESKETPIIFERCMCGTDGVLIVYEDQGLQEYEDEELPF